jgi:hypothetical protein
MARLTLLVVLVSAIELFAQAQSVVSHGPDCSGGWPTDMTQAQLKNAGLLKNEEIDSAKTKTSRLASEKVGRDLWHQVYLVTFVKRSGETIDAIVVHDASIAECSMSAVEVFLISRKLGSAPR